VRRGLIVGLVLLAGAAAIVAVRSGATGDAPLARTADGTFEVLDAVYGRRIDFRAPRFRAIPWLLPARASTSFPVDRLCVHVRGALASPVLDAACGCTFGRDMTTGSGENDDTIQAWITFPRRDRTLRMRFGPGAGAVAEFPNPFPAPPAASAEGVQPLPATTRVGDATWQVALSPDEPRSLVLRATDARGDDILWKLASATLSDASGNHLSRRTDGGRIREHRIDLPPADGVYRLCPHEPWWELEVFLDGARSVLWRFQPPR
jgi:hypothetical protein